METILLTSPTRGTAGERDGVRGFEMRVGGGTAILALLLPLFGQPPALPPTGEAWLYTIALALGTVWLANVFYFAALRRIEATPTAVAATIEPVVGTLLALFLLGQTLMLLLQPG